MPDAKLDQLKAKYQSVMNLMQQKGVRLDNVNMAGDKLYVKGEAPSDAIKNDIWNQVKLVDPSFSDLTLDISAPAAAAAAAAAAPGGMSGGGKSYTVQAGDSLSKIAQHYYGSASQYMKIFNANKNVLSDPDKIKPGMNLVIPD
ncbi:MAG: LysM peptidoglycan-binding domain-containing protein [Candidatus Acidiferrales bacterium]